MVASSQRRVDGLQKETEAAPVEFSTNPLVRSVFRDEIEVPEALRGRQIEPAEIDYQPLNAETPACEKAERLKSKAVDLALLLMILIQLPSGAASFCVSPETEWEIIGGCIGGLLLLKVWAAAHRSLWVLVCGTVLANVLMGSLVGEAIVIAWELASSAFDLPHVAGLVVVALLAAAFYACLIGDVMYIKGAKRVRLTLEEREGSYVVVETPDALNERDKWWLTWGLTAGAVWGPFHLFYLLMRLADWLTAVVLLEFLREIFMIRRPRR